VKLSFVLCGLILFATLTPFLVVAQTTQQAVDQSTDLKSFQRFAERFGELHAARSGWDETFTKDMPILSVLLGKTFEYDIKKTDSMVSPVVGCFTAKRTISGIKNGVIYSGDAVDEFRFAFKDNGWRFVSGKSSGKCEMKTIGGDAKPHDRDITYTAEQMKDIIDIANTNDSIKETCKKFGDKAASDAGVDQQPVQPAAPAAAAHPISFGMECIDFAEAKKAALKDPVQRENIKTINLPTINYGAWVSKVASGSGMENANLMIGDIITKVDKKTIKDVSVLKSWTESVVIGQTYTIYVMRRDADTNKWAITKLTFTAKEKTDDEAAAVSGDPSTQPSVNGTGTDFIGPRGGVYHYSANGKKEYNSGGRHR
jgi:hypothetical protein